MRKIWQSAGRMKTLAAISLALALAGIAVTFVANRKWIAIQGPVALQAVADDTVWLGVDDELWVLDAQGRRTSVRHVHDLGFDEAVGNIVLAPENQALLTSRNARDWQLVDRFSLARVRTIRPQWPQDIGRPNAVHLAVSPEGDIAAATGGGHAVLLFDREGRLLARTPPGTYQFTNGLWWSPEGWWTTDTNRFALHLLDARTLEVKRTVQLAAEPAESPFLGEAVASRANPKTGGTQAPLATLTRLGTRMEPGHVVDVFPDGTQALYNLDTIEQLRDITWLGRQLLVVDAGRFELRRYDADRIEVAGFGDAQVRAALARLHEDRIFWRRFASHDAWPFSLVLLLVGIAAFVRHRQLAGQRPDEARNGPAIEWLRAPAEFEKMKLASEAPREALYVPGPRPRWLLVTNRRILLFAGRAGERRLQSEWPRRGVVFAGAPAEMPAARPLWQQLLRPANLALTFTTGTTVYLRCASRVAAGRIAQLLMSSPAQPDPFLGTVVPVPARQ